MRPDIKQDGCKFRKLGNLLTNSSSSAFDAIKSINSHFRAVFSSILVFVLIPSTIAYSENLPPDGTWKGHYLCQQGGNGLSLEIRFSSDNKVSAVFDFFKIDSNKNSGSGSFLMEGIYVPQTRYLFLDAIEKVVLPTGWNMIDLEGKFSVDFSRYLGRSPTEGCSTFELTNLSLTQAVTSQGAPVFSKQPTIPLYGNRAFKYNRKYDSGRYNYDVSGYSDSGNYMYGDVDTDDQSVEGYLYDEAGNSVYFNGEFVGNGEIEGYDENGDFITLEVD